MVYANPDIIERICGNDGEDEGISTVGEPSEVQQFYEGTCVFVTGGSGFIGMVLVEKLLRTCPGIQKLFLLMRPIKGKIVEERTADLFLNKLFEPLRIKYPRILEKIRIISGDVEQYNLGISSSDAELLKKEVNIVFHSAATIRFDEPLRKAYQTNVVSLKCLLAMAESMINLKAFVQVSTAFCNTHRGFSKHVKEEFRPGPYTEEEIETILNSAEDYTIECLSKILLGKLPSTYILTKIMGEDLIQRKIDKLPIVVYRPGIVFGTEKEPLRGWNLTFQGAGALQLGAALGILRTVHVNGEKITDTIPVDKCASALTVLPWYIHKLRLQGNKKTSPIFQHLSNSITWQETSQYFRNIAIADKFVSKSQIWAMHLSFSANSLLYETKAFFFHTAPLPFFILAEKLQNKQPRIGKIYRKLALLSDQLSHFTLENWSFDFKNTEQLWSDMTDLDRRLFNFDMTNFNWLDYFRHTAKGVLLYVLKETYEEGLRSRDRLRKIIIIDKVLMTLVKGLGLFVFYKAGFSIFNAFRGYVEDQISRLQ